MSVHEIFQAIDSNDIDLAAEKALTFWGSAASDELRKDGQNWIDDSEDFDGFDDSQSSLSSEIARRYLKAALIAENI